MRGRERAWTDVSRPISPETPVWPGDPPWRFSLAASMARGDAVNVGEVGGTTHVGTHADAPLHVLTDGASIDDLPLTPFVGPAEVADVSAGVGTIEVPELEAALRGTSPDRLLLSTGCGEPGAGQFRGLGPEAAAWCVGRGVLLVGTDAPSIDPPGSATLDAHRALLGAGVAVLEGLALAGIEPGGYELVALPLRWAGADASPVRAVLRRIEP